MTLAIARANIYMIVIGLETGRQIARTIVAVFS